jgi:Ca2+-transporting ATPase
VQKFIQFQLTINLSALAIAFLSPLLAAATAMLGIGGVHFRELPLTVLQLLWINLIMDTLAALALSLEPPRDELMRDAPRSRTEPFITGTMAANILVMATYFTVVNLVLQATDVVGEGWTESYKNSFLFTTYVFFQVFNAFNARSVVPGRSPFAGVLQSRMFLAIVALIVVVQVGVTTFGGVVFGTEPLRLDTWVLICALTSTALVVGALFRGVASMLRSRKASLVPADRSA